MHAPAIFLYISSVGQGTATISDEYTVPMLEHSFILLEKIQTEILVSQAHEIKQH